MCLITILIFTTTLITSISCACNRDYYVSNTKATRFQAYQICKQRNSNLVTIENDDDAKEFLNKMRQSGLKDNYYWMGGLSYWRDSGSKWWFDNLGREMKYGGWCNSDGQPEERSGSFFYQEPCVAAYFRNDAVCWHDFPCFATHYYVCSSACGTDVVKPEIQFGEFCYRFDPQHVTTAIETCRLISRGRSLITLESAQKVAKLSRYFQIYPPSPDIGRLVTWLNLKRQDFESNVFVWNYGAGPVASWINWAPFKPYDVSVDCAYAEFQNGSFLTYEVPCHPRVSFYYVCE